MKSLSQAVNESFINESTSYATSEFEVKQGVKFDNVEAVQKAYPAITEVMPIWGGKKYNFRLSDGSIIMADTIRGGKILIVDHRKKVGNLLLAVKGTPASLTKFGIQYASSNSIFREVSDKNFGKPIRNMKDLVDGKLYMLYHEPGPYNSEPHWLPWLEYHNDGISLPQFKSRDTNQTISLAKTAEVEKMIKNGWIRFQK